LLKQPLLLTSPPVPLPTLTFFCTFTAAKGKELTLILP
jgi:hypothetical protein